MKERGEARKYAYAQCAIQLTSTISAGMIPPSAEKQETGLVDSQPPLTTTTEYLIPIQSVRVNQHARGISCLFHMSQNFSSYGSAVTIELHH